MTEDSLPPMELFEAIKLYSEHVDQKFTEIIQEFSDFKREVTERFDRLEKKVSSLEDKVNSLEVKVEAIEDKMSTVVTKQQLNRLLLILETRFLLAPHESEFIRQ